MAEDVGSLVVRVAMDNSGFEQGVQNLNRSMKIIQSEFKNATSGLKDHGKGLDGLKSKQEMLSKSIDAQSKIVSAYKDKLKESKDTLNKNSDAQEKLKSKVDVTKNAYEESKKVLGSNAEETKKLKVDYENLSKEYTTNEEKLRNNVRAIDNWNIKANNAESKLKEMENDLGKTTKEVDKQSSAWNKLSQKLDPVGAKFKKVGDKMSSIGKDLTTKVSAPIAGLATIAVKTTATFLDKMSEVKAVSGATGEEFNKLTAQAKEMGIQTRFSASEAAEAQANLASAGFNTKEIMAALPATLNLAASGNVDLAQASDIAASTLRGFGMDASQTAHVTDVLARAAADTNAQIPDLGESMKYIAPLSKAMGYSIEETAAACGLMANAGIKGSQSGTTLRGALIRLTNPSKSAAEAMDALKFKAFDMHGKMLPLPELIKRLQKSTKGLTDEQKNAALSAIFGQESLSGMLALVNAGPEELEKLSTGFKNSDGAAKKMANTMEDNIAGSFRSLKSALEGAAISIGETIAPMVKNMAEKVTQLTRKFAGLDEGTKKTIVKFAAIAAVAGPILIVFGKLISGIGSILAAFGTISGAIAVVSTGAVAATPAVAGLATAFTVLTGPVGFAIAAIAGIGVAIYECVKHFDKIKEKAKSLSSVGKAFAGITIATNPVLLAVAGITLAIKGVQKAMSPAIDSSKKFGQGVNESTKKALTGFEGLKQGVEKTLFDLNTNSSKITDATAKSMKDKYVRMSQSINKGFQDQKSKELKTLDQLHKTKGLMTDKEYAAAKVKIQEKYTFEEGVTKAGCDRANAIVSKALKEKRELTKAEKLEIQNINDNMQQSAVKAFSKSATEEKKILENLHKEKGKLRAEDAAGYVKHSKTVLDSVKKNAKAEYDAQIKNIDQMKKAGAISDSQAEDMKKKAGKTKDKLIKDATDQHTKIVAEAKKQAKEHAKEVDWETGQVKSNFKVMTENVISKMETLGPDISKKWHGIGVSVSKKVTEIKNNTVKGFEGQRKAVTNKTNEIKTGVSNKWHGILNFFGTLPSKLRTKGTEMFEGMRQGIHSKLSSINSKCGDIGNTIKDAFTGIPGKMLTIGHDIMDGLKNGLMHKIEAVKNAAGDIANAVTSKIKGVLDIHSPSRLMTLLGQHTGQGFANGIKNSTSKVQKASEKMAKQAITATKKAHGQQATLEKKRQQAHSKHLKQLEKQRKQHEAAAKKTVNQAATNLVQTSQRTATQLEGQIKRLTINTKDYNVNINNSKKAMSLLQQEIKLLSAEYSKMSKIKGKNVAQSNTILKQLESAKTKYVQLGQKIKEMQDKFKEHQLKKIESSFKNLYTNIEMQLIKCGIKQKGFNAEMVQQQKILDIQKQKLELLKKEYTEVAKLLGTNSEKALELKKNIESLTVEIINSTQDINDKLAGEINNMNSRVKTALKQRYDDELKAQEEHVNNEIKNLDRWKDESIKRIESVYDAKIKAMDEQMKAEDKAEKENEELKRIEKLKTSMQYEHNEFNKAGMQKELSNLLKEREKRLHKEQLETQKEKLQKEKETELKSINNIYESSKQSLEKQLENYRKTHEDMIQDAALEAQAEKMIMDNNQVDILNLLHSYEKDYEQAGQSLGERLVEGFKPKIEALKSMLSSVQSSFEGARTSALNAMAYSSAKSTTNNNSNSVVNNNEFTFNSPKALKPSEIRRQTETTLRNLSFA